MKKDRIGVIVKKVSVAIHIITIMNSLLKRDKKSIDELPSILSVKELHTFLGISFAGAYQLLHREDFPTLSSHEKAEVIRFIKDRLILF